MQNLLAYQSLSNEHMDGKGLSSGRLEQIEVAEWELAHRIVLQNTTEVQPFIE